MNDQCEYHTALVADIAVIKNDLIYIRSHIDQKDIKFDKHVQEAECEGGFRDRVQTLERDVKEAKKIIGWPRTLLVAVVGGLIVRIGPDIFQMVADYLIKVVFAK